MVLNYPVIFIFDFIAIISPNNRVMLTNSGIKERSIYKKAFCILLLVRFSLLTKLSRAGTRKRFLYNGGN